MVQMLGSAVASWWLGGLLALWAALLFGGFALGREDAAAARRMPVWTRMASSLALVAAALGWCALAWGGPARGYALAIGVGMSLGAVGDLALAGWLRLREPVLAGMAAFGLGHVAYIAGMLWLGGRLEQNAGGARLAAWAVWLAVGAAGWYVVVFRRGKRGPLRWAALPYALLLASTAGLATGLALQTPAFVPLAIGGALFLLSDLILAGELFGGLRFRLIGDVVWLTYGPAQALIVTSVGFALAVVGR